MLLPELLLLGLAVSLADSYDRSVNYWEAFAPGKLLQRLDALTVSDVDQSKVARLPEMMQPVLAATNQAQAKADEDVDLDVDVEAEGNTADEDDVDSLSAEASHEGFSGEDYERNYEQFVKEYFDQAADNHYHDHDDDDLEEETQAEATNVKDQRCRRVKRKDGQLCEICRQLKNNEVSETCSYSHDDQPEQYAYGSGTQFKRYRNDPAEKKEKDGQEEAEPVAPSSLCVRRQQDNSVCYECKDSKGQKIERCYDVQARKAKTRKKKASSSSSSTPTASQKRKPRSQQSQQSEQEQRIYKRTISYSYAQGTDQQQEEQPPPDGTTTDLPVPRQRRRRLVKITRRRGPVRVQ
ncbi:uncharacterized protein [Drosophila suzukii]|uniref:Uncharacterized protein n=1 Tax=Drosophila suzukii TaxID=28584 RepID=A0AB39ZLP6_DROSZ